MNTLSMPGMTALFGGNWNNASNAGTFNWNLNNATSNVNSNIGTRVTYFTNLLDFSGIPCLLAKHINEKSRAGRVSPGLRTLGELYKEATNMKRYGHLYDKIYDMDYLSAFDHWMKETNRVRYYYRYCDDIVVLGPDKLTLRGLLEKIGTFFSTHLKLRVKENWQVFPTFIRGIDFLGYRCFGHFTLLRKSTVKLMKKKLTRMLFHEKLTPHDLHVIGSYHGWVMWCDGHRLAHKYIDPLMRKEVMRL